MKLSSALIKEYRNYNNIEYDIRNLKVLINYCQAVKSSGKIQQYIKALELLQNKVDHLNYLLSILDKAECLLVKLAYIENLTYMQCIEFGSQIDIDFGYLVDIGEKLEFIINKMCQKVDKKYLIRI